MLWIKHMKQYNYQSISEVLRALWKRSSDDLMTLLYLAAYYHSVYLLRNWLAHRNRLTDRRDVHALWNVHPWRYMDYVWLLNWHSGLVRGDPDIRGSWWCLEVAGTDSLLVDVEWGCGLDLRWCALECDVDIASSLILLRADWLIWLCINYLWLLCVNYLIWLWVNYLMWCLCVDYLR